MIYIALILWFLYFCCKLVVRVCEAFEKAEDIQEETWLSKASAEMTNRNLGSDEILLPNHLTGGMTRLRGARKLQAMRPKERGMN